MNTITQNMKYRQSVVKYAIKNSVAKAACKYNRSRSYIYFWLKRYDGTIESLADRSKRPHSCPNQHTEAELKLIGDMKHRNPDLGIDELWLRLKNRGYTRCLTSLYRVLKRMNALPEKPQKPKYVPKPYEQMSHPGERVQIDVKVVPKSCYPDLYKQGVRLFQYTAIDEYSRMRYLFAYEEQNTYSSADFLKRTVAYFSRLGVKVECVQTDNGFEFTNRFNPQGSKRETLFERTARELGIRHKLIRPYTPRHNGKVERSHREDQKRFYSTHSFYSLKDFATQLAVYLTRSNNRPMRPLKYATPREIISCCVVQYV